MSCKHPKRSHALLPICLSLLLTACATIPKYPAKGRVADQYISTTVDSEITRYYLEQYLQNKGTNPQYDEKINKALQMWDERPLDTDNLKRVTTQFSPDFATLYFVSRIYINPENRMAQQAFHSHVTALRTQRVTEIFHIDEKFTSYLIVFVPGYAYKRDPITGADFALQRRVMGQAGLETLLVKTDEIGTIEKNASILVNELTRLEKSHDKIILVSTSKAGPEVALAIGKLMTAEQLMHVKAWISIGGLLRGSPIADQALKWPKSWFAAIGFFFKGLSTDVIGDLSTQKRREVFAHLHFPEHILLIQYVGVPLSGDIGEHVEGRYRDLREHGPNDGLTLVADELIEGSIVITDVGLDHYYLDREIDLKTLAVTRVIFDELERREKGKKSDHSQGGRPGPESKKTPLVAVTGGTWRG